MFRKKANPQFGMNLPHHPSSNTEFGFEENSLDFPDYTNNLKIQRIKLFDFVFAHDALSVTARP